MNESEKAVMQQALDALKDCTSGWRYIRHSHGDLYGVGWDRAEGKGSLAITALEATLAQSIQQDHKGAP